MTLNKAVYWRMSNDFKKKKNKKAFVLEKGSGAGRP